MRIYIFIIIILCSAFPVQAESIKCDDPIQINSCTQNDDNYLDEIKKFKWGKDVYLITAYSRALSANDNALYEIFLWNNKTHELTNVDVVEGDMYVDAANKEITSRFSGGHQSGGTLLKYKVDLKNQKLVLLESSPYPAPEVIESNKKEVK